MRCSLLTLSCYVDDELEARPRGEMEAHLLACQRCRSGLSHLEEEVERVGALAGVRVADDRARALLEQLGIVTADEELPPRAAAPAPRPASSAPPWFGGGGGPVLPWTAPPRAPRALATRHEDQTSGLVGSAAPLRRVDEVSGVPAVPFDLAALRREAPPPIREAPPLTADVGRAYRPGLAAISTGAAVAAGLLGLAPSTITPPPVTPNAPPPEGDAPVPVRSPDPAPPAPPTPLYPITDEDAEALDAAQRGDWRRAQGGPLQAPRPTVMERMRERLAMRRALLSRGGDEAPGIEVVSGAGAPARHGRTRDELARRRVSALRPEGETTTARRPPGAREQLPPPARPGVGRDAFGRAIPPGPPATPLAASAPPLPISGAQRDVDGVSIEIGDAAEAAAASAGSPVVDRGAPQGPAHQDPATDAIGVPVEAPRRRSGRGRIQVDPDEAPVDDHVVVPGPAPVHETPPSLPGDTGDGAVLTPPRARRGRILLACFAALVVAVFAIGQLSGRTTVTTRPTSSLPSDQAPVPSAAAPSSSASQSAAPSVAVPAPGDTVGAGGTGWQVRDFRFGGHTTFYRVVLDFTAPAGGGPAPTVTVANQDPQTIIVTLAGTEPQAGPVEVSANAFVKAITSEKAPAGSAAYRIVLNRPAAAKTVMTPAPVRLILDIG